VTDTAVSSGVPEGPTNPDPPAVAAPPAGGAASIVAWWDFAIAAAVVAAAAALRYRQLGPRSLWLDDAWPALVVKTGWSDVTKVGLTAPGFAAALKAWLHVTGFSETKAQSFAFVCGIAAPGLLWLLCVSRRLGRPAAAVATAALLTSPAHIVYSARVKQYTLDSVIVIVLVWLTWRGLEKPSDARRWYLLAIGSAVATALSSGVVPVVGGAFLAALFALVAVTKQERRRAYPAFAGYAVFAAAWWRTMLAPRLSHALTDYWRSFYVSNNNPGGIPTGLRSVATRLGHASSDLPLAITLLAFLAAAVVVVSTRRELSIMLLAPLLIALVLALCSLAPIGTGRTDVYLYPLFALLLAVAVSELTQRRSWCVLIAVALTVSSLALARSPSAYPQEDMKYAVAHLQAQARPDDTVMVYPAGRYAFALYAPRSWPVTVFTSKAQTNGFDVRVRRPHLVILDFNATQQGYDRAVTRATRGATRVWFIGSHGRLDALQIERSLYDDGFRAKLRRSDHEAWFLSLWVRRAA
jgi:hypothetical protein